MSVWRATARPRVGLLGNPSDLYQGRVLGFTFRDFRAEARLQPAAALTLVGPGGARVSVERAAELRPLEYGGGCQLMAAAVVQLAAHAPRVFGPAARPFELSCTSDIPRQVGFSGSSALVVASLRVLAEALDVPLDPFELSELALAAEVETLGSTAGPQDRVLQAFEGLYYMDFSEPRRADRYARLDAGSLPPLFLAWDPNPGADSGAVHSTVRERWLAGDAAVRAAIAVFPRLAAEGLDRLHAGDRAALADLLDAAFETRASLFAITAGDRERVDIARQRGAGATLCGSGGAIVGIPRGRFALAETRAAFEARGHRFLVPEIS